MSAPRTSPNLFYRRRLPNDHCPIVAGRRLIPLDLVPVIEAKLRDRGLNATRQGGVV